MIELLTTTEMAQADRLAVTAGVSGTELMENAGRAVADCAARHPLVTRMMVVAGPGNNGGDGFVAARILAERGYRVGVLLVGEAGRLKGDAAAAAQRFKGAVEAAAPEKLAAADVIIDALFGAGLTRPVEGLPAAMIAAMNARHRDAQGKVEVPIVAVDLPSGINGDNGAVMGAAVRASETVTFFRRKPGHVLLPGRLHCGAMRVADIGIPEAVLDTIRPRTFLDAPALWSAHFPVPRVEGHKYSRGHAVVVSGGLVSSGAARLGARGALRAGAGLVTIASPREALAVHAAALDAIMVRPVEGAGELAAFLSDARRNAVLLGPGGGVGAAMREQVMAALAGERGVVLDADALTSFAEAPETLFAALRKRADGATVLTPHGGEFARLFKVLVEKHAVKQKLELTRVASHETGAIIVLKGADSVIASPDGRAAIAENAPPWLATAGSGDVLAGMITGLLAQGMPAFEAACAGVWLHGEAGRAAGPGLIAEDLPETLPALYRALFVALGATPGQP